LEDFLKSGRVIFKIFKIWKKFNRDNRIYGIWKLRARRPHDSRQDAGATIVGTSSLPNA
jgi:hypothetical protein